MIAMLMYAKIRRMRLRDKLEISEIARRTSLSRNTIKKWLRESDSDKLKYKRGEVETESLRRMRLGLTQPSKPTVNAPSQPAAPPAGSSNLKASKVIIAASPSTSSNGT